MSNFYREDWKMERKYKLRNINECKRRLRLVLNSKLNGKNKIRAINALAVAVFRYGAGIQQCNESDLKMWTVTQGK